MKKPKFLSRLFNDDNNIEIPFFFFLTLVLIGLYIWGLTGSSALDSFWKIALFTFLMAIHIALYWISPISFAHPRWLPPILVTQGLVAFAISLLVRVAGISYGLYPGLIGLVIGLPVRRLWRVLAVSYYLILSLVDFLLLTAAGTVLGWLTWTVPVVTFVTIYVSLYLRQAEAREQAQKFSRELEVANDQLREYAAQVEDLTIVAERQRMARELHDTLSQGLAGLILQLEATDAHLAGDRPERARGILQQSMEKARLTLAEARQAIDNLRQPVDLSLEDAIRQEIERFTSSTGIPCKKEISLPESLPESVAEICVRVVAEGLNNIARHAQAKSAELRISEAKLMKELQIEIEDDGVGFEPEAVETGHYGLLGIRERIRLAGGKFDILSSPEEGTQLVIRLPLKANAHD
jgi:NarL family two-component system sensor histidine kinase YdfH